MNIKADHRKMQNYPEFPFSTLLTIAPKLIISAVGVVFSQAQQIATNALLSLAEKALGICLYPRHKRAAVSSCQCEMNSPRNVLSIQASADSIPLAPTSDRRQARGTANLPSPPSRGREQAGLISSLFLAGRRGGIILLNHSGRQSTKKLNAYHGRLERHRV